MAQCRRLAQQHKTRTEALFQTALATAIKRDYSAALAAIAELLSQQPSREFEQEAKREQSRIVSSAESRKFEKRHIAVTVRQRVPALKLRALVCFELERWGEARAAAEEVVAHGLLSWICFAMETGRGASRARASL